MHPEPADHRRVTVSWRPSRRACAAALIVVVALSGCARIKDRLKGEEPAAKLPTTRIVISGVTGDVAENVRAYLGVASEPCTSPEWRVSQLMRRADQEVDRALRAFGHYHATVTGSLERESECWVASFEIRPGDPVIVRSVRARLVGDGADDSVFKRLFDELPIREGTTLNHGQYERAKSAISGLAAERGYLRGRFAKSELRVDPGASTAEVELEYDSGPRFRFGELRLRQDALDPALVRRFSDYREGEPYLTSTLNDLNRALTDSGYFDRVDVRPDLETPGDGTVPVEVVADPRKTHGFTAGVGVTTDTGPRARLGYENRRLNRRGHRVSARTEVSLIERSVSGQYRIPLADPRAEWLSFDLGYQREITDTTESETFKLGARQTKKRGWDWLETRFIDLTREDFEVGSQRGIATLLVPGVTFSRSRSDNPLDPSRGHRLFFGLRGGHEAALSETSFIRARAAATWLYRLSWGDRLITRGEIGAMSVTQFSALPPSQRFFAGGDTSVRGYDFREIGPEDDNGDVIGGRYLGVGSLEYERPVRKAWSVAGFVDAGNAFNDDSFDDGLRYGVGLGLRWQSPIGPVRVDLAHPVNDDRLLRLHLRIGPDL